MLMCTILTFAMCADPNVQGELTFGDLAVPIVWSHVAVRSCPDIGVETTGEAGLAQIETAWRSEQSELSSSVVRGRLVAKIDNATIDLTAYSWDHMTPADEEALRGNYRATLWHEIGHLRTAQASVDAINAEPEFSAPTPIEYDALVRARGDAVNARLNADQEEYDRAAEHGLRQSTLPPPLGGPDTIVTCPSKRR